MAGSWLTGSGAGCIPDRPRVVAVAVSGDNGADDSGLGSALLLSELRRLADTDGVAVVGAVVRSRLWPDPSTYVDPGEVGELTTARAGGR